MKLLMCLECNDIFNLDLSEKSCSCGRSKGKYINQQLAEYTGEFALPLGFTNSSLIQAIKHQPNEGMGKEFTAFVIPKNCETFFKRF
ncbi:MULTISPECIES: hypothetical protein [Bacillaceae]|uniref:Uncharacterized protein n=2 Tax=Robertmurraya TaxID=2837507 RepID=A0A4U1D7F5_9BACI|nr:hypothetical protein [Niallia sp. RD1]EOR25791.1 hypothetical protein A499_04028 [Niallia nealsonii AAU1]TKC17117.1 hypothetical protein FA727_11585 [Robertmurraya kyonggiensis]UTI43268.1 hypothetical protein NKG37_05990 [Niallia sp. RD1]